jgi:hypothetical protein
MQVLVQDVRYAARALASSPGFVAVALLSLAVGIGANSAIVTVASALLLRPLPYANAERLVILWNTSPGLGITEDWFSTAQYTGFWTIPNPLDDIRHTRTIESVRVRGIEVK